jgi:hypothetical protein
MSAAKNKNIASGHVWLGDAFAWLAGPGRPVLIVLIVLGLFLGGWYLAWHRLGPVVVSSREYLVGPEQIELDITPKPTWIHSDLRAEVFRDVALEGQLSILDEDLAKRIAGAFVRHPWVDRVVRVTKMHPNASGGPSVKVELVCRRPVCMVDVPGDKPLPVDAEGVLLPSGDFTSTESFVYPRLMNVDRPPPGSPGQRWSGDPRVVGAAEIAAAFGPAWYTMKLHRIEPFESDPVAAGLATPPHTASMQHEPFFVLTTHNGTQILWGNAPRAAGIAADALSAAEKVARLERYFRQYDTLDAPDGKPLDVRTLPPSDSQR